jgi:hypothetical protein
LGGAATAFACTGNPYGLTFDPYGSQNAAAFGFTSSNDDVGYFNAPAFSSVETVGFNIPTGTMGGVAIRDNVIYAIDTENNLLRSFNLITGQMQAPIPIIVPGGCLIPASSDTRTFVVGDDGTGYLVVAGGGNCVPGLVQINLSTGATIATISSGLIVASVANDYHGHIYYYTTQLYRYPSVTAPAAHARRLPPNGRPSRARPK